jgi:hypothetical protein
MMEGTATNQSLVDRMIGAARLDVATYEDVEHDESATTQALIVVLLSAIAAGIGALGGGVGGLIIGVIAALVGWVVYAFVAYWVGTNWFKGPETSATHGELLRTLGFASTPRLLLVLAWIPVLGWLILLAVFIWMLITTVIAIRQALDFDTGKAIATAVVSWIPLFIVQVAIAAIAT